MRGFWTKRSQAARGRSESLGRDRPVSSAGCSTTASTRGAMNLAVRTTPPVRVSSRTSTVVRELRTSTVRPALVASTVYSRAAPEPASTKTSTKSPFATSSSCPNRAVLKRPPGRCPRLPGGAERLARPPLGDRPRAGIQKTADNAPHEFYDASADCCPDPVRGCRDRLQLQEDGLHRRGPCVVGTLGAH